MFNSPERQKIYLPLIIALSVVGGLYLGKILYNRQSVNFLPLKSNNDKLSTIINLIDEEYVDNVNTDSILETAIPEVLQLLDPHSVYIPAKDVQQMNEPLLGSFEGIGVQFNIQNDTVMIVAVISGGPSEKVGVLPGDRIVSINDSAFVGKIVSNDMVMKKLKGKKGTKVKLGLKRHGINQPVKIEITRDEIPLYSVDVSYMVNENTGYVKINHFARTTHEEFLVAVNKLHKQGMKKLILDLRGNGGGYLDAATNIADEFLDKDQMIVYTMGKARPRQNYTGKAGGACINDQVAVLIDTWSASASEILAGAIQDNDRGIIIGRRSFGKGLVQEPIEFRDGSSVRLTIARYYTPTGRSIQKPYRKNVAEYEHEALERYENGELENADSVKITDTLKYRTPKGKIVYGGGGIYPDIFVPMDTTGYSHYLKNVAALGTIYKFALEYADNNRQKLSKYKTAKEISAYLDEINIFNLFIAYATKNGVARSDKDIRVSNTILKAQIKANVARNILNYDGYYPIIHEIDEVFKRAVDELSK